ncbi:MAG: LCP family protein [Thermoleophilia bacterium]|nr:LCP family protein [Thermoleophilia bacterium]
MDDDRQRPRADKPYRTYRGGGRRRSSLDDELAGLKAPKRRRGKAAPGSAPASGRAAGAGPAGAGAASAREAGSARGAAPGGAGRDGAATGGAGTGGAGAGGGAAAGGGPSYRRYGAGGAEPPAKSRRRFRWWHVPLVLVVLLVVAGVVAVVLAYPGYKRFDKAVDNSNRRLGPEATAALDPDEGWSLLTGPTTVLLLGVDSKQGEPARSDTILLMRFDPDEHTVNQLSIPRDTLVDIPGYGESKLNSAIYWGGPELAVKTLQQYLGIPINHVMIVNFKGFPRLVNSVGGVDMYVPQTVQTIASRDRVVVFEKGWQHFDGKNAMLYVRIRMVDDDFHRARRQQQFVAALQKKIAQPSNLWQLPDIGRRFMSGVDTDLTTNELLALGWVKYRADDKKGRKMVLAGEPTWQGGVSYVLPPSGEKMARVLARFLGE